MRYPLAGIRLVVAFFALSPAFAGAEGLSREQGEAILGELRQIRILLERQQRRPGPMMQVPAPQVPGPRDKVTLRLRGDHSVGRGNAPVVIVEYTDYQCPACTGFQTTVYPDIKRNFIDTGKARFIKRDLPLDGHPNALAAAQAVRCAGDQGKFWEMHDLLSANPSALGPEAYARFARDLSVDAQAFEACVNGGRHLADIRAGAQEAASLGIRSTPSFVIGIPKGDILEGIGIKGAQPYEVFERAIAEFLTAAPAEKVAD